MCIAHVVEVMEQNPHCTFIMGLVIPSVVPGCTKTLQYNTFNRDSSHHPPSAAKLLCLWFGAGPGLPRMLLHSFSFHCDVKLKDDVILVIPCYILYLAKTHATLPQVLGAAINAALNNGFSKSRFR